MTDPERRQSPRVQAPVMVEFQDGGAEGLERTFTQDVSDSGMRFPTRVKLEIGQELPLVLHLVAPQEVLRRHLNTLSPFRL